MSWSKGERAEDFVAAHLGAAGWFIEARNYRRKGFEIDIIASRFERLLCIEVKARRFAFADQDPHSLLTLRKIQRLFNGMNHWHQETQDSGRNAEFWLCIVGLPLNRNCVSWQKWEGNEEAFT
ncbi:MAG: YraN family protein [Chitinophagaceae bacterium]|nr:YraN family protein [Oligoflexus sp.]